MNKRIRYGLDNEGFYVAKKIIETAQGEVVVKFSLDNRVVLIHSANHPYQLLDTFVSTTDHQIKIDIKNKLVSMGAVFEPETRNHKEKHNVI